MPTKEPVSYDWERMQKFRETMGGNAKQRHALEVKADLHNPKRPEPFHLRDVVQADGAGEVKEIAKGKKKKKKKAVKMDEGQDANTGEVSAGGSPSGDDVSAQPAQDGDAAAPEPQAGEVAPQRRRKKKAVAT